MARVETVRGPVATSALGRVLVHEHVLLMNAGYSANFRPDFFQDDTIRKAAGSRDGA